MSDHLLGGRYRLQQPLGHGGTATVWRARDTRLDRSAAVKILDAQWRADPVAIERLRREARSVARLAHRNIVGMYDVDVAGDAAYLVMELVEGRSLTEVLLHHPRLPVDHAVSIAAQICDALGAAHAAGVVHRDIKPSNVLISRAGVVKVCDFGVALLDRAACDAALTGAGAVVGTCQYMAPEQAAGDPVDGRADLYAVGCVLYAMLAGAPPFAAHHPIDVLDLHLNEPPVPLLAHRDDVPPDLHRLVDQMLAKHPADRPGTAWSVRDRLRAIAGPAAQGADGPVLLREDRSPLPTVTDPAVDATTTGRHRTTVRAVPILRWLRRCAVRRLAALLAATIGAGRRRRTAEQTREQPPPGTGRFGPGPLSTAARSRVASHHLNGPRCPGNRRSNSFRPTDNNGADDNSDRWRQTGPSGLPGLDHPGTNRSRPPGRSRWDV